MRRPPTFTSLPVETRAASGEQKLAARMIEEALADARGGDESAARWLARPEAVAPWAGLLHVSPARLVALAAGSLGCPAVAPGP